MKERYAEIIKASGCVSLLDVLHVLQDADGYITPEAIVTLAEESGSTPAKIYETATFYSMIRFAPPDEVLIQVCRSAPCHVAGADEIIRVLEDKLGIRMGEATPDGRFRLEFVECLGQCQSSPGLLINGVLHTELNAEKTRGLLAKRGRV